MGQHTLFNFMIPPDFRLGPGDRQGLSLMTLRMTNSPIMMTLQPKNRGRAKELFDEVNDPCAISL